MYVLVVEPDRLLGQTYGQALEHAGHTVQVVTTAQSAVAAADEHQPDAVVLEPAMPRHNGIEFLYEFKSYSEWHNIPVVVHTVLPISKFASAEVLRRELGVRRILDKTQTTLEQLCTAVAELDKAVS